MKTKQSLLLMALMAIVLLSFTACKDDDKDDGNISGTYVGTLYIDDEAVSSNNVEIKITNESDNKIHMSFDQSIGAIHATVNNFPAIVEYGTIEGITGYWVEGEGEATVTPPIGPGSIVDAGIFGIVFQDRKAAFSIEIGDPYNMTVDFEGRRK